MQSLEQERDNDPRNQIIQDLKQKLEQLEKGDVKSLSQSAFTVLNPGDKTRARIDYMSKLHEWISLGDELQQNANPGYTVSPSVDTYMEQRENLSKI